MANQNTLALLKEKTFSYMDRYEKNGGLVDEFFCPCCNKPNKTTVPRRKDAAKGYWDSLTTCYECGELFMTIRKVGGEILVLIPD